MSYYGAQGLYTRRPIYAHRDGTIDHEPERPGIGYHDACAPATFRVPGGFGHAEYGFSWQPWLAGVKCETCGKEC